MTLETAVITATESQTILAAEADWLLLTDAVQEQHIAFGSVYAQTNWTCLTSTGSEIDWTDAPDDIKTAVAYYSLANYRGTLFPDTNVQADASGGTITEITKKLGTMQKTVKYQPGARAENPLAFPDTLMGTVCSLAGGGGGSRKAVRT